MESETGACTYRFDEISDEMLSFLSSHGISKDLIIVCANCDLTIDGSYKSARCFVLMDKLIITEGEEKDEFKPKTYAEYLFSELKEVKNENYIANGFLVGVFESGEFSLCAYTNSCSRKMGHLAKIATKLIKNEEIKEQDFELGKEERFCKKCGSAYPDMSHPVCPKCTNHMSLFLRVMSYAPKYIGQISLSFVFMMLITALNMLKPYISGVVLYDQVLGSDGKYRGFGIWAVVAVVVILFFTDVFKHLSSYLQGRIGAKVAARIIYDLKSDLFSSMQRLSMSFFNSKQTGSLMTRVNNDALDIQYFLNDGMPFVIINVIQLVVMAIVMGLYDPMLTLLVFLPTPLVFYMIKKVIPRFKKLKWRSWGKRSKLNSVINDALSGMRVIKAFGKEENEVTRFSKVNNELYDADIKASMTGAKTFPIFSWIMSIGSILVWLVGGYKVSFRGDLTFGTLIMFINYLTFIYGPLNFLINCFDWWTNCMNSAQRMFEIIDRESDVAETANPVPMDDMKAEISISNVTFEYEANKPVLHRINLDIAAGEMIGLVGHSGAGKSTITNLITRLYDVTEGEIKIDGVDIKDISFNDLRSQIGMVLQDTFLFTGTIAENISYSKPTATREEIITAAKLANAHDFIIKMPDGYETVLGKRKNNLSGGEQQRISIARAILVNPKILILDEATASVDTETESLIQEALERLTKGRTTIAIAHRLSTLRNADRLVVVDHGAIKELGTHEELEALGGEYYKMLQLQKEALKIRGAKVEQYC